MSTAAVKVNRDGTITRDGETIGRVEKKIRQGIFATIAGASFSSGGTPYWIPFDADGNQLNEYGYDTRKRAVRLVEEVARPTSIEVEMAESFTGTSFVKGWVHHKGHTFGVSRYTGENGWGVDFYCAPGSIMPAWSNGDGARYLKVRALSDELGAQVTKAAEGAGLWPIPKPRKDED